jgi:hypothetical protein
MHLTMHRLLRWELGLIQKETKRSLKMGMMERHRWVLIPPIWSTAPTLLLKPDTLTPPPPSTTMASHVSN